MNDYEILKNLTCKGTTLFEEIKERRPDRVQCLGSTSIEGKDCVVKGLSLSGCDVTSIPKEIASLTNLSRLYLRSNKIRKIEHVENLHLERLFLEGNEITTIKGLPKKNSLDILNLSNNKIRDIGDVKEFVKNQSSLSRLLLWGNPMDAKLCEKIKNEFLKPYYVSFELPPSWNTDKKLFTCHKITQ